VLPERAAPVPETRCEVCAGTSFRRVFEARGAAFEECERCKLVRVHTDDVFDYTDPRYVETVAGQALSGGRLHAWTIETIERHHPAGSLIEVGCSIGSQLARARGRGWDVLGFELNPDCRPIAHHMYRVDVRCEDFVTTSLRGVADVVLMCQLIEHVVDPKPFLAASARVLRPGGLLALATPNWNFAAPWAWMKHHLGTPLPKMDHVRPPEHLRLYRPYTMHQLANAHGWRVVAIYDNPTHLLGRRSRWSLRGAVGSATALVERWSRRRVSIGANMLVLLEHRGDAPRAVTEPLSRAARE
jgi:2-polyprenyl-3-methyl-5-hydroxy-6-metoxy-1,4-benzoquinol methylase